MVQQVDSLAAGEITLATLIKRHGRVHPARAAFIDGDTVTTWGEFDTAVSAVARLLAARAVLKAERVGLLSPNSAWAYSVLFGIQRRGAVPVPFSLLLSPEILARLILDAGVKTLFVATGLSDLVEKLPGMPGLRVIHERDGLESEAVVLRDPDVLVRSEDPCSVIYSSGTTGTPKGIVHSHRARLWMAADLAARFRIDSESKVVLTTPPYSNGTNLCLLPALYTGATSILMRKFDAASFSGIAERHQPTHAFMVPTQFQSIVDQADAGHAAMRPFKALITAGAPMTATLRARVIQAAGQKLFELWGLTEGVGTNISPEEMSTHPGAVGRMQPGSDLRLIDANGQEIAGPGAGEIVGRSMMIMNGYLNRPTANAEIQWVSPEGLAYVRTGDIGEFDTDGYLWIRGRSKDMIISGGFNVYPIDIEEVLARHPHIADACVFGIPDEKWGETPVGYVIPTQGSSVSAPEILAWINDRVSRLQRVRELRVHEGDFPRNAMGKVLKAQLKQRFTDATARGDLS